MYPRQRLFRAVNWALQLTALTLAFLGFAFLTCPSTSGSLADAQTGELWDSRPPGTAPEAEQEAWRARYEVVHGAAYRASGRAFLVAAITIGLPAVVLLVVVILLLRRARGMLERGV